MILATSNVYGKPIVIAVIDSGFGYTKESLSEKHLCKYGHKDFTNDQEWTKDLNTVTKVPLDQYGHGTHMVGIIDKVAGNGNYCFVIVKFISGGKSQKLSAPSRDAIKYAIALKPDIINFSGGGVGFDYVEHYEIEKYLDSGGIFVAAAGNEGKNLEIEENAFYPAMYDDRIKVVGNNEMNGEHNYLSSYGKPVKYWEMGMNIKVFGLTASGTSSATAIRTGKIVKGLNGTQSHKTKKVR